MATRTDLLVPAPERRHRLTPIEGGAGGPDPVREDLEWLSEVLGADGTGRGVTYRPRVAGGELRFLAPTRPAPAAAASLRRIDGDRGRLRRMQGAVGAAAARRGLLGRLPGTRLVLPPFELVGHLATVLDEPDLVAAVTLGPRRRNRKPVLQLLRPDGSVVGFAKVGWSPLTRSMVDNEADMLDRVAGRLPASIVAPAVVHHGCWRDGSVTVVSGLTPTRGNPGTTPDPVSVSRAVAACAEQPPTPVRRLDIIAAWDRAGLGRTVDLDRLVARHGDVELPVGLWHGDFTPWNMAADGDPADGPGTLWLWDWELAGVGRPIGFDLLHRAFELHRRRPRGTSAGALALAVADAGAIVAPLGLDLTGARLRALVNLYLCELIAREHSLAGQRWDSSLADLGPAAIDLLGHRLRVDR